MDKKFILAEIRRTAANNGGKPLGQNRFANEAGIKKHDWYGKYWARWGDALEEAGFQANTFQGAYDVEFIVTSMIEMIRHMGSYPTDGEVRLYTRDNPETPSSGTFARFRKHELARKILDYCSSKNGFEDIIEICKPVAQTAVPDPQTEPEDSGFQTEPGLVYLQKMDRWYYIGRTTNKERRYENHERTLPVPPEIIAELSTSDNVGMEAYWHKRFEDKAVDKKGKTWFKLTAADVRAFKTFYAKPAG